ncbi:MAG: hypothetical protein L3J56_00780 [Bacteroidales bacterium]|nr:hypothetical protein [Bacteroidales bacterium]
MKKLKYIVLFLLSTVIISSCDLFDKSTVLDANSEGNNIATFEKHDIVYSQVATGDEYTFDVQVKVKGPSVMKMTGDVPVTIEVDTSSTAIAGTHYRIDNNKLTLKADNNYLGTFAVTMITAGIVAPLPEDPQLVLNIKTSGSSAKVVGDGVPCKIDLVFGCLSHFDAHTYSVVATRDGAFYDSWSGEVITKTGVEEYRTTRVGHWVSLGVGTPGYTFYNKCDVLTVPKQNLVDYYSNQVQGAGTADPVTGVLDIVYTIKSSGWESTYEYIYTPEK